jgi:glycine hydroxymethyltransferase
MLYLKNYLKRVPEAERSSKALAVMASLDVVAEGSPDTAKAIVAELFDQRGSLKLIASENYSSLAVQLAMGNWLTDKYSEGIAGRRFYAGCENVDTIEEEAAGLAKRLFSADHAYVQPHSGADANLVAFLAVLSEKVQKVALEGATLDQQDGENLERIRRLFVGQRILGMGLSSGGHLTHGFRQNISSKLFQAFSYEVDPVSGLLDYGALARLAKEVKPLILIGGYSAYPRRIDFAKMREIADSVGAVLMVDMAHFAGLVGGKVFRGVFDPVPYAQLVTTTTHKTLRGPRGGMVLCKEEFREAVDKGCPYVLGGPLPHVMAAKAVAFREALRPEFALYAEKVVENAGVLADELMRLGVDVLTSGTDNHLVLVNVAKSFGLTGRQAETALREAHLTVNRNSIPQDIHGAWYTSGIRMGTPATTTLGMGAAEMKEIASIVVELLQKAAPEIDKQGAPSRAKAKVEASSLDRSRSRVADLVQRFPLYPELKFD